MFVLASGFQRNVQNLENPTHVQREIPRRSLVSVPHYRTFTKSLLKLALRALKDFLVCLTRGWFEFGGSGTKVLHTTGCGGSCSNKSGNGRGRCSIVVVTLLLLLLLIGEGWWWCTTKQNGRVFNC
jgi:hypothetical protein